MFFSFSQVSYSSLKEQFLQSGQYNLRYNTYSNATNCVACRVGVIFCERVRSIFLTKMAAEGRVERDLYQAADPYSYRPL